MSGLPALRCFIFFAADLFILVLPPFSRKAPEQISQGFTLIYCFELAWMDEFVFKPRESFRVKSLDKPVDHVTHPRDAAASRMKRQPNIERPAQFNLERYYLPAKRTGISRKYADAGAIGDRPVVGAADVGLHHQSASSRETSFRKPPWRRSGRRPASPAGA